MEDNANKAPHPEQVTPLTEEDRLTMFTMLGIEDVPNAVVGPILEFLGALTTACNFAQFIVDTMKCLGLHEEDSRAAEILREAAGALEFLAPILGGMVDGISSIALTRMASGDTL